MKEYIDALQYAPQILQAMNKGILLTTKVDQKVNSMTIGWGTVGIEWGKPIFIAFVREGRHTRTMLDKCREFTVNVPLEGVDSKILGVCGSKSGRDIDKGEVLGLTFVDGEKVGVPAIAQLPLTLECKVIYSQLQDANAIPLDIKERNYPQDVDGKMPFANRDFHIAYYGEIVNAYILH